MAHPLLQKGELTILQDKNLPGRPSQAVATPPAPDTVGSAQRARPRAGAPGAPAGRPAPVSQPHSRGVGSSAGSPGLCLLSRREDGAHLSGAGVGGAAPRSAAPSPAKKQQQQKNPVAPATSAPPEPGVAAGRQLPPAGTRLGPAAPCAARPRRLPLRTGHGTATGRRRP